MKSFIYKTRLLLIIIPMLFIPTDIILISSNSGIVLAPSLEERRVVAFENQSLESSDWFSTIKETIQKEEYYITYAEEMKAYQSPNRAQNLRFIYNNDGFTAKPRTTKIPLFDVNDQTLQEEEKQYRQIEDWQVQLQVDGYGRGNQLNGFSGKELTVHQNKAFIEDQGLKIYYENSDDGMRQNFIVKDKPEGNGLLELKIIAETKLTMRVGPDAVVFTNKASNEKIKYNSLKVWDSEKKTLDAHFKKATNNCFAIVVHDENAVYPITIDPLSTTANWTVLGDQTNSLFGFSVSTAGDVNGDGYSDVIVGAYWYDWIFSNEGRAFVYHGSASGLSISANWSARSEQAEAWFGYSVSTAGDVNGDGYSDVVVGAYQYDHGQTDEGRVCVWYGSSSGLGVSGLPSNADWSDEGDVLNADFGKSVTTAGDVNGDGYSDILIGAPGISYGYVYAYHGSSSGLSTTANWSFIGDTESDVDFGIISTAGDVNCDGYSDIILGMPFYNHGQTQEGRVYVFHGSSSGLSAAPNWSAESNQAGAMFGSNVSTAGDVNGDGYSDILICARQYDNGQTNEGGAFAWYGSSTGLGTSGTLANADWSAECNQEDALLNSVSTAGDINGDGYADIVIGASNYDNGQISEGGAFGYYGSSSGLSTIANWATESNEANASFGRSVATAGDVNGDGYSDVIVGAISYGASDQGAVFAYHGSSGGLSASVNWTGESNQAGADFGFSVSTAGDVNGDNYSDVIIGAIYYDNGQTDEGMAFVYHGSSTGLSVTANWSFDCDQASARFGSSVCTAGDVNGDGYCDVIVGASYYDNTLSTDAGRAFVYHGSSSGLSATSNWEAIPGQATARYGVSVATAGDVNGDGYSDVIVGADTYDNGQMNEGRAYAYYGSSTGLSASANWTTESNVTGSNFGCSVATAGDVNGDGFYDVIVGASQYANGQSGEGAAFVYHGSMTGLATTANWTTESNQASAYYGCSVSIAGDVNGDGFSDVIIGSRWYDDGQSNEGGALVYYGSSSGLSPTADWFAGGNQADANFGYSVSTTGDVNGDSYSDVIVGAIWYDNGEGNEGRAYVYHGSSNGLSTTANWTAESNQMSAYFGCSVAAAGDVNADGYGDVIVGAYSYDNGEDDEGSAFVYYGNNGGGMRGRLQQYIFNTTTIVGPHGRTTMDGVVRFNGFGKSPHGRADGKLVYEYTANGLPYGSIVNSSGEQTSFIDLGTSPTGVPININVIGIPIMKNYRWRERIKYRLSNNPFQVYSPWRYYATSHPLSFGSFKPQYAQLPVELSSFEASVEKGNVKLSWTTQTEVSNYGFEVERAVVNHKSQKQNSDFSKIGFVEGSGNSNSPKNYSFTDEKPFGGSKFQYRLKQIDTDGQFEYSNILEVDLVPAKFELSQNYPNPFNSSSVIKYSVSKTSQVTLKIFNTLGEEIEMLVDEEKPVGTYEVNWNAANFPSGVYLYQLKAGEYVNTKKMLLLK